MALTNFIKLLKFNIKNLINNLIFIIIILLLIKCDLNAHCNENLLNEENVKKIHNSDNKFNYDDISNKKKFSQKINDKTTINNASSTLLLLSSSSSTESTFIGDYSSVDKFRQNVEHKFIYVDQNGKTDSYADNNINKLKYNVDRNLMINKNKNRYKRDTNNKIDICTICRCSNDNFMNIECDFNEKKELDELFDRKYILPQTAVKLKILLSSITSLRIADGFFQNTTRKINSVSIIGPYDYQYTQVEISPNAFNNMGPFPEIVMSNCGKVILRSDSFNGEFKLNITNSDYVQIYENAFKNTKIVSNFYRIKDLVIEERAFDKGNRATLNIQYSTITNLNRFEASLREIRFYNCTIDTVNSGTFDVLSIDSIVFERCKINVVKTKAITEKLLSPKLRITNGEIGTIEKDAISGSGITELLLADNLIDTIQENAIYVTSVNATIVRNEIKHLGANWLRVRDFSTMLIARNRFGDFNKFSLKDSKALESCKFEHNFITNPSRGSLNIENKLCSIHEISFYEKCNCNITWLEILSSRDLKTQSYCRVDTVLESCFNTTIFNVRKYLEEVCDLKKTELDCLKNTYLKKVKGEFLKPEDLENDSNYKFKLIYILSGAGLLIVLAIIVCVTVIKCISRSKSTATVPLTETSNAPITSTPNGTVQKDHLPKMFSPDDRRIINQTLQMMEQKYQPHVFDEVYRNTQILLRGNITEMQRVKAIGDIVQILDEECPNAGEDFVAFTDILYKHLASTGGSAPPIEPTYSEPTIAEQTLNVNNVGPYATSNAPPPPKINGHINVDHIYAEPTSVQQPLLTNEYASPLDRSEMTDLYSEPIILNDRDQKTIPPYAVINSPGILPMKKVHQTDPSTSTNLPDVLNPSNNKTLTNVKQLAQNFANDPNFHITYSPNSNRRIPKYTIPNPIKNKSTNKMDSCFNFNNNISNISNNLNNNNTHNDGSVSYIPDQYKAGCSSNNHSDNRSNHSGGSDITVQMDDIIEYADA